jgi:hypothetical protein
MGSEFGKEQQFVQIPKLQLRLGCKDATNRSGALYLNKHHRAYEYLRVLIYVGESYSDLTFTGRDAVIVHGTPENGVARRIGDENLKASF